MSEARAAEYGFLAVWLAISLAAVGALTLALAPTRAAMTVRAVNAALERAGDTRRLAGPASEWGAEGRAALAGSRFGLAKGKGGAVVFALTGGGLSASCVALVDESGTVDAVLPLGAGAAVALDRLPHGAVRFYASRIEAAERAARSREIRK